MSSVLIIGDYDEGVPLAFKLREEGHIVRIASEHCPHLFLTSKNPSSITSFTRMLEQFDLILSTREQVDPEVIETGRLIGAGAFHSRLHSPEYLRAVLLSLFPEMLTPQEGREVRLTFLFSKEMPTWALLSLPYARMMEGDRGPRVHAGLAHKMITQGKLFSLIAPLLPLLQKVVFRGPLAITLSVKEQALQLTNISASLDPSVLQGICEITRRPLFALLWKAMMGEQEEVMSNEYSICTSLLCADPQEGSHYLDPAPEALPHLWPISLKETPEGFQTSGGARLGTVSARGISMKECKRRVNRTIERAVKSPEVMWRRDIGDDAEERFEELRGWGWLM